MEELDNIPTHIQTSKHNKITNPYNKGTINKFYGDVDNFKFDHQEKNYNKLTNKLNEIGIQFCKVYSSTIERKVKNSVQYGTTFIVTTTNDNIFWYKYEGKGVGSGYNYILIRGNKIKMTEFLKMDEDDVLELINL